VVEGMMKVFVFVMPKNEASHGFILYDRLNLLRFFLFLKYQKWFYLLFGIAPKSNKKV